MATVAVSPIPLRALKTQVGGHFMMLEIDRDWICKPKLTRETFFYENLPNELKQFTPKYKGLIRVSFNPDESNHQGYHRYHYGPRPSPLSRAGCRSMMDARTYSDGANDDQALIVCLLRNVQSRENVAVLSSYEFDNGLANPWIEFRTTSSLNDDQLQDHIILENLTGKLKCPCVMDLKLGTRTYSDVMSEEKKRQHSSRCASSTSKSLGVRLGGMQLYCQKDSKYYLMGKRYGHLLNEKGLYEVLEKFLCSSSQHKDNLIPALLERLKELREVIRQLDSYRLFSSSLLITYEGASENTPLTTDTQSEIKPNASNRTGELANQGLDVRMIDFCNATSKKCSADPIQYTGPDEGYIKGLTTVIDFYERLLMRNEMTH